MTSQQAPALHGHEEQPVEKQHKLNLAYLTTTYPAVSHTFIRRELREIESRGHSILRLSIRRAGIVQPIDQEESAKTIYCLSLPVWHHAMSVIYTACTRPAKFLNAMRMVVAMSRRSERGLFKHIAYLVEACSLLRVLNQHSIQHLHVHFGTNATAVARLIKCCGGPSYSFTVHGPAEFDAAIAFDLQGKIADASFVIAITDYCSAQLKRWSVPEDWNKIHVLHCTVGDEFFNSAQPVDPSANTFVCVGRLSPQKGQLVLIEAFAKLISAGYDSHLVFVGDGELRIAIEQRIKAAKLEKHVTITGYVSEEEVRRHIVSSRALVLPSFAEGLPMVIMESFALGRPVISTYIAGIPELVRLGENGWLVPAGNVDDLAKVMAKALDTPAERLMEMAASGRELTFQRHRTLTECDHLEALFYRYV